MIRGALARILVIAYQEVLLLRHNPAALSMLFAQPPMMLFLFGVCISNTPANVPWIVLDRSATAASRRLVTEITHTGYFLPPRSVPSYTEVGKRLAHGAAVAAVVIPRDFARDLERGHARVQVLLDGSDPLSAARVGFYVTQVVMAFAPGHLLPSRRDGPGSAVQPITVRQRIWFNPTLRDRTFFLAGLAGMLLTNLCLSITAFGIVGERESGTFEQTLALPVSSLEIILGKLVPPLVLSYGILGVTTVAVGLLFGIWPRGSLVALGVVTLPFVLASLAIGVFVSTLARTSAQAIFITMFVIMPSFVLSGVMLPYQLMPHGVREVGALLPLRWYQIALRRVVARGGGLLDIAVPTVVLFTIFAVLLAAIRWRLKPRLG